ncbi:MAG: class I SAM-dependent methyltransferase [Gemmatimonadota bacterium]
MSDRRGHPIRGRLNSWFLAAVEEGMHREYGERKVRLFGEIPGTVVELGPGAGANFRYYPLGTRVVAVEPNPMMHRRLLAQGRRRGIELDLLPARAEGLEIESASAKLVVSTLVLCSVEDPGRVVAEVKRILRPGGRFAFLEHVAASPGSRLRRAQEAVHRPWHWLGEGCHLTRDTAATLEAAGFASLEIERFESGFPWAPFAPHVAGVATR